jgi:RNA polymerase sigma factor (sigma-70 family)
MVMPMRPRSKQRMFGAISQLFRTGTAAGLSDAQLLERFLLRHDEAAEAAFAALLERHGPMVLAVCRRVLNDPHDAQDAFQATFLVLVRKAGTIRKRESIADWLHGVALRVAAHARADSVRRRAVERRAGTGSSIAYELTPADRDVWDEVELLPQNLRTVFMLCYLEGLTHEQAARRLGWPVGTVRSRLARARGRLRTRLTRRGLAPDTAFLPMLSFRASSLPEGFIDTTVKAAMLIAARDAAEAGLVSTSAAALTEGVLHAMLITKLKTLAVTSIAAGAIACGIGSYAYQGPEPGVAPGSPAIPPVKVEQSSSAPGRHDDARQPLLGMNRARSLFEPAAKLERLVRHAREAQARGDMEGAVRDLREIESVASVWKEALTRNNDGEKDELPTPSASVRGPVPGSPVTGRTIHPAPPAPATGDTAEQAEQSRGSQPAPTERRLDELERTVERLVRALERKGREDTERRGPLESLVHPGFPAPPILEGKVRKVNDRDKKLEIDIGSDDGLIAGHELVVYRPDRPRQTTWEVEFLGRIRVLSTNPDQSVAKVIELFEGKKIREGDRVSTRSATDPAKNTTSGALEKK